MAPDAGTDAFTDAACPQPAVACAVSRTQPSSSAGAATPAATADGTPDASIPTAVHSPAHHSTHEAPQSSQDAANSPEAVQAPQNKASTQLRGKRSRPEPSLYEVLLQEHAKGKLRQRRGHAESADAGTLQPSKAENPTVNDAAQPTDGAAAAKQGRPQAASNGAVSARAQQPKQQQRKPKQIQHQRQAEPLGRSQAGACTQKQQQQQQQQGEPSLLDLLWREHTLGKLRRQRGCSQAAKAGLTATELQQNASTTSAEESSYKISDASDTTGSDSDTTATTPPRKQRRRQQQQQKRQGRCQQQQQRDELSRPEHEPHFEQKKQHNLQEQQPQQQQQNSQQQQQQQQQQHQDQEACSAELLPQQPRKAEPSMYAVLLHEHRLLKLRGHKHGLQEAKPKAKRKPDGRKRSADCPAWSRTGLEAAVNQGAVQLGLRGVVSAVVGRGASRLRHCSPAVAAGGVSEIQQEHEQGGLQQEEEQGWQQQEEAQQRQQASPPQQQQQQQQQPEVGVLVLLHEAGWPNAAVWERYEQLHAGRLVVKVHMKAGVELKEGLEGWQAIQRRRLRTCAKAEWGDLSLTEAMLDSLGEMLQAHPSLQHLAVVSGHDIPVSLISRGLLPPGCSLFGDFKFGADFTEAARGVVQQTLVQQLEMEDGDARAWGQALVLHHTWVVLCRDLVLALLSRKDELMRIGGPLNTRFMQPDVALAADEFLLLTAAVRWGFVRSIHRGRLRVAPAKLAGGAAAAAVALPVAASGAAVAGAESDSGVAAAAPAATAAIPAMAAAAAINEASASAAVEAEPEAVSVAADVSCSGGSGGVSCSGDEGSSGGQVWRGRRRGPKMPPQPAAGALLDTYPTLVLFHPEHNRHPHTWSSLDKALSCDVRAGMPGATAKLDQAHLDLHAALSLVPVNRPLWFRKVVLQSASDRAKLMQWLELLWAGKPLPEIAGGPVVQGLAPVEGAAAQYSVEGGSNAGAMAGSERDGVRQPGSSSCAAQEAGAGGGGAVEKAVERACGSGAVQQHGLQCGAVDSAAKAAAEQPCHIRTMTDWQCEGINDTATAADALPGTSSHAVPCGDGKQRAAGTAVYSSAEQQIAECAAVSMAAEGWGASALVCYGGHHHGGAGAGMSSMEEGTACGAGAQECLVQG